MNALSICATALLAAAAAGFQHDHRTIAAAGIPPAVQEEHKLLQQELAEATHAEGATGAAAAALQRLMQPHFEAEEEFALSQLGALHALATSRTLAHPDEFIRLSAKLEANLPKMLDEHRAIGEAIDKLAAAARAEGKARPAAFAADLRRHAAMEEQIMYPAAILVGKYLKSQHRP